MLASISIDFVQSELMKEAKLMQQMDHKHIVRMIGESALVIFCFKYMPNSCLKKQFLRKFYI